MSQHPARIPAGYVPPPHSRWVPDWYKRLAGAAGTGVLLGLLASGCAGGPDPQAQADVQVLVGLVETAHERGGLSDEEHASGLEAGGRLGVYVASDPRGQLLRQVLPFAIEIARELWANRCVLISCAGGSQ